MDCDDTLVSFDMYVTPSLVSQRNNSDSQAFCSRPVHVTSRPIIRYARPSTLFLMPLSNESKNWACGAASPHGSMIPLTATSVSICSVLPAHSTLYRRLSQGLAFVPFIHVSLDLFVICAASQRQASKIPTCIDHTPESLAACSFNPLRIFRRPSNVVHTGIVWETRHPPDPSLSETRGSCTARLNGDTPASKAVLPACLQPKATDKTSQQHLPLTPASSICSFLLFPSPPPPHGRSRSSCSASTTLTTRVPPSSLALSIPSKPCRSLSKPAISGCSVQQTLPPSASASTTHYPS